MSRAAFKTGSTADISHLVLLPATEDQALRAHVAASGRDRLCQSLNGLLYEAVAIAVTSFLRKSPSIQ